MPESVRQETMVTGEACGKGVQTRGKGILKQFFFYSNVIQNFLLLSAIAYFYI